MLAFEIEMKTNRDIGLGNQSLGYLNKSIYLCQLYYASDIFIFKIFLQGVQPFQGSGSPLLFL